MRIKAQFATNPSVLLSLPACIAPHTRTLISCMVRTLSLSFRSFRMRNPLSMDARACASLIETRYAITNHGATEMLGPSRRTKLHLSCTLLSSCAARELPCRNCAFRCPSAGRAEQYRRTESSLFSAHPAGLLCANWKRVKRRHCPQVSCGTI